MSNNNKLEDKLGGFEGMNLVKDSVLGAERDYRTWCRDKGIDYHQSDVHTFEDTRKQALVLALTGKDKRQQETLAKLTYHAHLWDDYIDPRDDNIETFGDFKGDYFKLKDSLPKIPREIMSELEKDFDTPEKLHGLQRTMISTAYGALIDESRDEQEKYCEEYRQNLLENISDKKIRTDMSKLHPVTISLIRSTDMNGFYVVSDNNVNSISSILSCFYAPMLHSHNGEEESASEGSNLGRHYGKNLMDKDGKIKAQELSKLIDVFDSNIEPHIGDIQEGHLVQMKAVYKSFENVLPSELQDKYRATIKRTNELYIER